MDLSQVFNVFNMFKLTFFIYQFQKILHWEKEKISVKQRNLNSKVYTYPLRVIKI